ncbi:hypothetical protein BKP45_05095 [Anaerobacillus alkalidiazotrophicus]|uniref:Uncharacterized protein n=1 Tax=Anaerobacillus alkalidiazotrophicus TaxID=472963 RepID=A0A1S2MEE6_9BACI|nr:hypothetical protein [Anaerobacillus alkalidiazotrophicus]OIJ22055.1 hypothetical protein BKP45_05095 [Anaerobacillus alkalidiazotrophicus]
MFFKRKKDNELFPDTNDVLIVFDDEKKTSDIQRINEIRDNSLYVHGHYNIPIEDTEITNSEEGRNFFYRAPSQSITETRRLAQLEKSIVLRHITEYKQPQDENGTDITKMLLIGAIIVAFIMFGLQGCSGSGGV